MSDLMNHKRQLLHELTGLIEARFSEAEDAGVDVGLFADTAGIARAMVAALPTTTVQDQQVGPFYDTAGLTTWLGVSKQAIAKRVTKRTLIGCQLASGTWVYPTWQFTEDAVVDKRLSQVWQHLRNRTDAWTAVLWMCSPCQHLENTTAVQYLAEGGNDQLDTVLHAAQMDTARWTA